MDPILGHSHRWHGILEMHSADSGTCHAHGQAVVLRDFPPALTGRVMMYDVAQVLDPTTNRWTLVFDEDSSGVQIPPLDLANLKVVKEICSGVGGIGQGLKFLGYEVVATMDVNPYMCGA